MGRSIRLTSFEDHPTGSLGLIIKGCEGPEIFSDNTGRLLAHDILEHQNGIDRIGDIDDELEALGALWQVRGRHGDLVIDGPYYHSVESSVASDVLTCATDFDCQEDRRWYPRLGQYRTRPLEYHDDELMAVLEEAKPMIRRELDCEEEGYFDLEAFMDNALHLMRRGFRKAQRRFGDRFDGLELFRAVRDAIQPHAKHLDGPGQEFILTYGGGRATCRELPFSEYD